MTGSLGRPDDVLVAIDTSTRRAVVALGMSTGAVLAADPWIAGDRHGEELLPRLGRLLDAAGLDRHRIGGLIVGIGPGAFTGLRVGIATAKGLAHGLAVPLVGVSSADALLAAARDAGMRDPLALLLPAGPNDRVLVEPDRPGDEATPRRIEAGEVWTAASSSTVVAVDLADRASDVELARGEQARDGLAAALMRIGAARLAVGRVDDLATLGPIYVTPPRGVRAPVADAAVHVTRS